MDKKAKIDATSEMLSLKFHGENDRVVSKSTDLVERNLAGMLRGWLLRLENQYRDQCMTQCNIQGN